MEVKVKLSNLRTAPKKVRLVADLIRGKNLIQAQQILSFTVNKSARPVLKLLNSARASALNDFHFDESNLFVSHIMVDEGPKLKRWHPMSRGRAYPIIKRTSQIVLILAEINPTIKETKKENEGDVKEIKKSAKTKDKKEVKKVTKKPKKTKK